MIKASIYIAAVSLTVSTLVAQSTTPSPYQRPPSRPTRVIEWQIKNIAALSGNDGPAEIKPGVAYEIHNMRCMEKGLRSQLEKFSFVRKGSSFMFRRQNEGNVRDHRAIKPDEDIALFLVETGQYLNQATATPTPFYEWQLHHQRGARFALYNTKQKKYLVLIGDGANAMAGFEGTTPKPKQTSGFGEL